MSGSVVKGPVAGASVVAVCHDTGVGRQFGAATTDSAGSYRINVSEGCNAVVELRASGGSYVDEATGVTVTAPAGVWIHALVDASTMQPPRTVHITALTEVQYQRATAGATVPPSAAKVAESAAALSNLMERFVGSPMDAVTLTPSLVAGAPASEAAQKYSLLLAAMSHLMGPSTDSFASTITSLAALGAGNSATFEDALRFVAASDPILQRIGVSKDLAASTTVRAESFIASEALFPLTLVADSSGLSCDPLQVMDNLSRLVSMQQQGIADRLLSSLSMLLASDNHVKAMQAWKARCPALAESLNIYIAGEQASADLNYADFAGNRKPLRDCAAIHGIVTTAIVRGRGEDLCVAWNGSTPPTVFALSSVQPGNADPAISYERCVELTKGPGDMFGAKYAIFFQRGTSYLYCGRDRGGFDGWLDRQNTGYYPDSGADPGAGSSGTGSTGMGSTGAGSDGTGSASYEELAAKPSRLFTGTNYQVRTCTDSVDELFPDGVGANTEPRWPAPYYTSITTGMTCTGFDATKYQFYSAKYQSCANYRASDFEAVGRRGYADKITLAASNLSIYYDLRQSADPVHNPGVVCKQNGW